MFGVWVSETMNSLSFWSVNFFLCLSKLVNNSENWTYKELWNLEGEEDE